MGREGRVASRILNKHLKINDEEDEKDGEKTYEVDNDITNNKNKENNKDESNTKDSTEQQNNLEETSFQQNQEKRDDKSDDTHTSGEQNGVSAENNDLQEQSEKNGDDQVKSDENFDQKEKTEEINEEETLVLSFDTPSDPSEVEEALLGEEEIELDESSEEHVKNIEENIKNHNQNSEEEKNENITKQAEQTVDNNLEEEIQIDKKTNDTTNAHQQEPISINFDDIDDEQEDDSQELSYSNLEQTQSENSEDDVQTSEDEDIVLEDEVNKKDDLKLEFEEDESETKEDLKLEVEEDEVNKKETIREKDDLDLKAEEEKDVLKNLSNKYVEMQQADNELKNFLSENINLFTKQRIEICIEYGTILLDDFKRFFEGHLDEIRLEYVFDKIREIEMQYLFENFIKSFEDIEFIRYKNTINNKIIKNIANLNQDIEADVFVEENNTQKMQIPKGESCFIVNHKLELSVEEYIDSIKDSKLNCENVCLVVLDDSVVDQHAVKEAERYGVKIIKMDMPISIINKNLEQIKKCIKNSSS